MLRNSEFTPARQMLLRQFAGTLEQHLIGRDEYCSLMLSRRQLQRCNDDSAHRRGLFDPCTGEVFDVRESELFQR